MHIVTLRTFRTVDLLHVCCVVSSLIFLLNISLYYVCVYMYMLSYKLHEMDDQAMVFYFINACL